MIWVPRFENFSCHPPSSPSVGGIIGRPRLPADAHAGWVADVSEGTNDQKEGLFRVENGNLGATGVCARYPVWCCS